MRRSSRAFLCCAAISCGFLSTGARAAGAESTHAAGASHLPMVVRAGSPNRSHQVPGGFGGGGRRPISRGQFVGMGFDGTGVDGTGIGLADVDVGGLVPPLLPNAPAPFPPIPAPPFLPAARMPVPPSCPLIIEIGRGLKHAVSSRTISGHASCR